MVASRLGVGAVRPVQEQTEIGSPVVHTECLVRPLACSFQHWTGEHSALYRRKTHVLSALKTFKHSSRLAVSLNDLVAGFGCSSVKGVK